MRRLSDALRRPAALAIAAALLASAPARDARGSGGRNAQGEPTVEIVDYRGWDRNLRIANGEAELIVTLDVGPRIISYRLLDGENVFKNYDEQLGRSGESSWMIRGGHRLWTSPEDPARTYIPDNGPVEHAEVGPGRVRVTLPADRTFHLEKEMEIALDAEGSGVSVIHRVRNCGSERAELAIWSLSVMKPGGVEVIPLPPDAPHPGGAEGATAEDFAPQFSMAFWPYSDFTDPRFTYGKTAILLRQDSAAEGPTKVGIANIEGAAAYLNGGTLFVKRFPYLKGRRYPDFGSSYETFTNKDMLEMESLGPLVTLGPGEVAEHVERWELIAGVEAGDDAESIVGAVLPRLDRD